MASASQVCNGSWADLPTAPPSSSRVASGNPVRAVPIRLVRAQDVLDVQGAEFAVQDEQADGQKHVTDTGDHEGFAGSQTIGRVLVVETDQ
jgi:hypothetical protein